MRYNMSRIIVLLSISLIVAIIASAPVGTPVVHAGIATTRHNLSRTGPGTVKATTENRLCVFCHTPHHAIADVAGVNVPLWNHTLSTASYQLFSSGTLLSPTSPAIQPDGSSRLCLSCHDGTVAIGSVVNTGTTLSSISMQGIGAGGEMPAGINVVGTDLSGDHPISIEINSALITQKAQQCKDGKVAFKVCNPPPGSPIQLVKTNNRFSGGAATGVGVQCSTCHDPHEDPVPGSTVFLRMGNKDNSSGMCTTCHIADCLAACP